jgi:hypothetical protein
VQPLILFLGSQQHQCREGDGAQAA